MIAHSRTRVKMPTHRKRINEWARRARLSVQFDLVRYRFVFDLHQEFEYTLGASGYRTSGIALISPGRGNERLGSYGS